MKSVIKALLNMYEHIQLEHIIDDTLTLRVGTESVTLRVSQLKLMKHHEIIALLASLNDSVIDADQWKRDLALSLDCTTTLQWKGEYIVMDNGEIIATHPMTEIVASSLKDSHEYGEQQVAYFERVSEEIIETLQ